jgi:hypothetical protein
MNVTPEPGDTLGAYRISDLPPMIGSMIWIHRETRCWLWQGRPTQEGYCQAWWEGKFVVAHRLVYEMLVGPVPPGLVLDHVKARGCHFRHCCWPVHLEPVTQKVNVLRVHYPDGDFSRCVHGHLWSENLYVAPNGNRSCRACRRVYEQAYRDRKKAARLAAGR